MDISDKVNLNGSMPVKLTQGIKKKASETEKTAYSAPQQTDRVDLSDRAREMLKAHETIKKMPDVDEEKVARIKARIHNGAYKVDGHRAAANILAESLFLSD
ncbi:MAG: flagellar biosynthesis anti-sigma factor FlgM [Desulfobacteraceae bacterium]|nr:flagellar biosynthesis anti-sigma factor FlgM [Desulfobacteraceae bacterium]